jgi:uncharacterized coiled-coil protein SlyX
MRKRIWEIEEMFYCPIAGICLSLSEQRKFIKRYGGKVKGAQDYVVHVTMINLLKKESAPAKRFERLLNRKYRQEIAQWEGMETGEWFEIFDQCLTPDTAGALLWFSALYLNLSEVQQVDVYGAIHMLMHAQLFQQAELQNQLTRAKAQHARVQEKYRALQTQRRHERQSFRQLERRHGLQQQEIQALHNEIDMLKQAAPPEKLQAECENLRHKFRRTEEKLYRRTKKVEALKAEKDQLSEQIAEHQLLAENMRAELAALLNQFTQSAAHAEHCPNFALCNRRILIVGGMTRLRAFYEELVLKMGGQFDYHDGYQCQGIDALSHLVERSDAVICPVDVNSHSACLHVKKCCKELNKPYYMLRNSSLSTIHRTLSEVARTPENRAVA